MGIVTWISVRLQVLPSIRKLLLFPANDIEKLISFVYQALRLRLGDECLILNKLNLASIMSNGKGIEAINNNMPNWALLLSIAGYETLSEMRIEYQENDITDLARQYGLVLRTTIQGFHGQDISTSLGSNTDEPYWKLRYQGKCDDIFFLSTLDKVPNFIDIMRRQCDLHQYPFSNIGVYIQPIQQGRSCHCEFNVMSNLKDQKQQENVKELFLEASEMLMREGAYFSRPYGPWADMVYNRDATSKKVISKFKNIFDPNNIMNPGKLI